VDEHVSGLRSTVIPLGTKLSMKLYCVIPSKERKVIYRFIETNLKMG